MNLGLKLDFKKGNSGSGKSALVLAAKIWIKSRTILFFVLLLASIVGGGFIWQKSVSGSGWSAERKQEFMDSQDKNVQFKQQAYLKVLDQIKQREEENNRQYQPVKNIFSSY